MKRTWMLAGPILTIGSATTAIITIGRGAWMPQWVMIAWLAVVIFWSLNVIVWMHANQLNRKTIDLQTRVIQNQAELLGQILTQDIDGRD